MSACKNYDVLIVGARCAGAATAMLLARRGLRVLVIDRGGYGTDTVSTHALMRGGVLQLHRWGVLQRLIEAGTPPITNTTFHYGEDTVNVAIRASHGVDALYAPRRTLLDSTLVDAAQEAGATVLHGHALVDLLRRPDGGVCGGVVADSAGRTAAVEASLVVGADGVCSSVARLAAARMVREASHTTAVVFGYFPDIALSGYHWWYRSGLAVGAIPTNRGRHCIFAAMPRARLRSGDSRQTVFEAVLREVAPSLAATVTACSKDEPLQVFAGRAGFLRQAFGSGWALVGDAGYFKDPLTAHGITDALRDAELLANAIAGGTRSHLAEYAAVRDALSLPLFEVTDAIAALDWDQGRIKALHHALNEAMKREVEHLLALDRSHPVTLEETAT